MSVTVRCRVCQEWRHIGEIARAEVPYRCLRCVGEGRTVVDEPSELDRLRERAERVEAEAREWESKAVDYNVGMDEQWVRANRAERERDALRAALAAARIPHLHVDNDPWFSCPLADERGGSCLRHDMGGPCPCGCTCGAEAHNARIDAALGPGEGSA